MRSLQAGRQGVGAARLTVLAALVALGTGARAQQPTIGLITKTESNPFFVKMREGAQAAARSNHVRLMTAAGKNDGDNAGQVTAIENMMAAGAKVILLGAPAVEVLANVKRVDGCPFVFPASSGNGHFQGVDGCGGMSEMLLVSRHCAFTILANITA